MSIVAFPDPFSIQFPLIYHAFCSWVAFHEQGSLQGVHKQPWHAYGISVVFLYIFGTTVGDGRIDFQCGSCRILRPKTLPSDGCIYMLRELIFLQKLDDDILLTPNARIGRCLLSQKISTLWCFEGDTLSVMIGNSKFPEQSNQFVKWHTLKLSLEEVGTIARKWSPKLRYVSDHCAFEARLLDTKEV